MRHLVNYVCTALSVSYVTFQFNEEIKIKLKYQKKGTFVFRVRGLDRNHRDKADYLQFNLSR